MRRVVASSPAKVILFGEHFVVRGTMAIAAAIDLRAKATVEEIGEDGVYISSASLGDSRIDIEPGQSWAKPFWRILRGLEERGYGINRVRITLDSPIPVGAGLGSSAATASATALALSAYHGHPLPRDELITVVKEAEEEAHGRPSGIDPTVSVLGGIIGFSRNTEPVRISKSLDEVVLIVAYTGVQRNTGKVVQDVLDLVQRRGFLEHIYTAADKLSTEALKYLEQGSYDDIGELMNINHGMLSAILVSSPELEDLVYTARGAGALGAKITGAGRGGSIIAIARKDEAERVINALSAKAQWVGSYKVDTEGARIEAII